MVSHPAMKFVSKTDYFSPDAIKERALRLTEFFVRGPYDYAMLLTLLGVWNDQFRRMALANIPFGSRSPRPPRTRHLRHLN